MTDRLRLSYLVIWVFVARGYLQRKNRRIHVLTRMIAVCSVLGRTALYYRLYFALTWEAYL